MEEEELIGSRINRNVNELASKQYKEPYEEQRWPHFETAVVSFNHGGHHKQNIWRMIKEEEKEEEIDCYDESKGWKQED